MCFLNRLREILLDTVIQFKVFEGMRSLTFNEKTKVDEMKMNDQEEIKTRKCANCTHELFTGDDALTLQLVVLGVQRPIPLEATIYLHRDRCLEEYVCNSNGPTLPKRIP